MTVPIKSPRKLIEVALPLDAINEESARSKRKAPAGYPTTLHTWWAQRPLAAARAVVFAQLVNDPGFQKGGGFRYGKKKSEAAQERKRLFELIERMVKWENSCDPAILHEASEEILRSWRDVCALNKDHPEAALLFDPTRLPGLHDPFAGGGSIPLEAQRLGLETIASDLNPVAVLINKALVEIPPRFAECAPVHPALRSRVPMETWSGATGLAADVKEYGCWMRREAQRSAGDLYPPILVRKSESVGRQDLSGLAGQELEPVAYLWARTVRSPSPGFAERHTPLVSSFVLSTKKGKEFYVDIQTEADGSWRFVVKAGKPGKDAARGTKVSARGADFRCIHSGAPVSGEYIKAQGKAGEIGLRLMALVAKGQRGRVYLSPTSSDEEVALGASPGWRPAVEFAHNSRHLTPWAYGMSSFDSLFTARQLTTLGVLADLVPVAIERAKHDAVNAGFEDDDVGLAAGGRGARAYAEAVGLYLAFAVDRVADYGSSIATWRPKDSAMRSTMSRQAVPMTWDFAEGCPFGRSSSGFSEAVDVVSRVLLKVPSTGKAFVVQRDAQTQDLTARNFVSTDPPYYDNVPYADLADFFYVWLRRSLRGVFPDLFATIAGPKNEELVADAFRHSSRSGAERFFLEGMSDALLNLSRRAHPGAPLTIYYAFKQSDTRDVEGTSSSGWETFLEAVVAAGLRITGTWPVRTEGDNRQRGNKANALASSVVLVCRPRPSEAPAISRRQFLRELDAVLPDSLDEMTKGAGDERSPVAPVDLSQAIIGPGMAVFSKYSAVLEADGSAMSVRTALQLINRFLAEDDFDHDTQFCLHWFEQHGWLDGPFGDADVLARAKATSVGGVDEAGVIRSGSGKVRLLRPNEYPADWNPLTDRRAPIWEALHQLIKVLRAGGESAAGGLLARMRGKGEPVRQLAYRLYTLCERRGWAEDARAYNELITSWAAIEAAAGELPQVDEQLELNLGGGQ